MPSMSKSSLSSMGGVSYEADREAYRGSVTINGVRYRTKRFATRLGARRALNVLIKSVSAKLVNSRASAQRQPSRQVKG